MRMTFAGLLASAVICLVAIAGVNIEANLLYLLSGICGGVLIGAFVLPLLTLRNLEVDRLMPDAVVAGRPYKVTYVVRNRRRYSGAWSLIVTETPSSVRASRGRRIARRFPSGFIAFLKPGAEQRIEVMATSHQRGKLTLPGVRISSRFPLGLFSCQVDYVLPAELLVFPALGRFRYDPWRDYRAASTVSSTRNSVRDRSGQEEFHGVREYRQGDNLRWIHWRASARTGELVVREMIPQRPTHMVVMLDPWPEAKGGVREQSAARFSASAEMTIAAAATALCDALEKGHRVGLVCRSARPVVIPPAAGRAQRHRILQELALAMPGATEGLDELVSQIRWSSGWHARCLLCLTSIHEPHDRVVRFLNARAEAVAIASPDKQDFGLLFEPPMQREAK